MPNTIFAGLSQQIAVERQMEIVSNNIANASTPGYRAQHIVFSEYLKGSNNKVDTDAGDKLSLVLDYGHYQSNLQGSIKQTGNPLNVALEGPGYIGVQSDNGIVFTRAGNFKLNGFGELVTSHGNKVAGVGGGTLTIPKEAQDIKISQDGSISTEQGDVGKLMISEFENEQELEAIGHGLYRAKEGDEGTAATETIAIQGAIEGSNVEAVVEITRMIDILRSYQRTQRMMQTEHERERNMIQRLSRTS